MIQQLVDACRSSGAEHKAPEKFGLVVDCMNNQEFAMAADVLVNERLIEPQECARVLEDLFSSPSHLSPRMQKRLEHLLGSSWAGIITTNYDKLVEEHLTRDMGFRICDHAGTSLGSLLSDPCRFFAKLHGESWKDNRVLTVEEYHRTYIQEPYLEKFLEGVMISRHLVFIGCSLEDDLIKLRSRLYKLFGRSIPMAYALLPKTPNNVRKYEYFKNHVGIECWLYDSNDPAYPDHGVVDEFLVRCAECMDQGEENLSSTSTQHAILKSIGRANRMLLRAVVSCSNQRLARSTFVDAGSISRQQLKDTDLRCYFSHYTPSDFLGLSRRFIDAGLLSIQTVGIDDYLQASPTLETNLAVFDQ